MDSNRIIDLKINYYVKARMVAVGAGVLALLGSFAVEHEAFTMARMVAWGVAGCLCIVEGRLRRKLGQSANALWFSAALFFAIAAAASLNLR